MHWRYDLPGYAGWRLTLPSLSRGHREQFENRYYGLAHASMEHSPFPFRYTPKMTAVIFYSPATYTDGSPIDILLVGKHQLYASRTTTMFVVVGQRRPISCSLLVRESWEPSIPYSRQLKAEASSWLYGRTQTRWHPTDRIIGFSIASCQLKVTMTVLARYHRWS